MIALPRPSPELWKGLTKMKVSFPAMRGQIGQRTYYSCLMPLSVIPKMFTFRDWADARPEDREQRLLNKKRVPVIAKYILDNEDGTSPRGGAIRPRLRR